MTITSCQQEDLGDTTSPNETLNEIATCGNDSTITVNFKFNYGDMGPTSANSYVKDIDFGPAKTTGVTSRASSTASQTAATVAAGILKFVGNTFLNTASARTANMVIDAVLNNKSGEIDQLQQMDAKINQVKEMINDLKEKAEDKDVRDAYNERMNKYTQLEFTNCTYFVGFCNALKKGDVDKAKNTVNEWAKQQALGTTAPTATYDYIEMINGMTTASQKPITEVYDYWVFRTTPWEDEGYQKREQLRAGDVCIATTGYLMALAYYLQNLDDVSSAKIDLLNKSFKNFNDNYGKRLTVEHHDDIRICQIKGAHVVLKKDLVIRDMKNHPWVPTNSKWVNNSFLNLMFADANNKGEYGMQHSLTLDEANAIWSYYKAENKSLEQILKDKGFDMSGLTNGKTHIMTLYTGGTMPNEHWYNNNYIMKYDVVFNASDPNRPIWSNFNVGTKWIEKVNKAKSAMSSKFLRHWVKYDCDDKDFFRVNLVNRFTDMDPFEGQK